MANKKITSFFKPFQGASQEVGVTERASSEGEKRPTEGDDNGPPAKRSMIEDWDVSAAVGRSLSTDEIYNFIEHNFQHTKGHTYPQTTQRSHRRSFQGKWLEEYPGLTYSIKTDEAFCLPCVLFGKTNKGSLVSKGFSNWKDAKVTFDGHFLDIRKDKSKGARGHDDHLSALERFKGFVKVEVKGQANVMAQLSTEYKRQKEEMREVLKSIFETVLLCARQGIALRGHRDDFRYYDQEEENLGNFLELIRFRAQAGDSILQKHLQSHKKNATYLSKTTQNECIEVIGAEILGRITDDIKKAKFFSISADELQDIANMEQMSVCLRYVDAKDAINEVFVGFIDVSGDTTGQNLAQKLLECMDDLGLDPTNLRGQCYDGAGNMAGKSKGIGPRIERMYPKALYFWCTSHQLNRAIVAPCGLPAVCNMMQMADKVARFFNNSSKRQKCLETVIEEREEPGTRHKLKELCRTRWTERHVAFEVFVDLYESIAYALEVISTSKEYTTSSPSDAATYLSAIVEFKFVMALIVANECLGYLKQLSTKLQSRSLDVVNGFQYITDVKTALGEVRSQIDDHHGAWFLKATEKAASVGVAPAAPRVCTKQVNLNAPADSISEHYKRNLSIPLLDHILTELESRFTTLCKSALRVLNLIPTSLDLSADDLGFYQDDLPSPGTLPQEVHLWRCHWKNTTVTELPNTALAALQACKYEDFPNIHTLLRIACTMPVTSCECERSFSALRRLKTFTRATVGETRLNCLALAYVHRSLVCKMKVEELVDTFIRKGSRRLSTSKKY